MYGHAKKLTLINTNSIADANHKFTLTCNTYNKQQKKKYNPASDTKVQNQQELLLQHPLEQVLPTTLGATFFTTLFFFAINYHLFIRLGKHLGFKIVSEKKQKIKIKNLT